MRRWAAALLLALASWPGAWALPGPAEVRAAHQPSDAWLLSRDGEPLHRLRTDATVRRGPWVELADVSPALRTALVLSEDRRFHEHSGVDWRAVSAAAWANLWDTRTRGASTLTMQLAGLLDDDLRASNGGRSVGQKLGQVLAAQRLERQWRKDQILEAYLNLVPWRGELVGIDALSRALFGKAPHGLDEREAALAVALVRAPNAGVAQVAERTCGVLRQLRTAAERCDGLPTYVHAVLSQRHLEASDGVAPHLARQLLRPGAGNVRSTLHAPLQRFAVATLHQQLRELQGRQVNDGAVLVLDNASGEVLAWVGSSGGLSAATEVDAVLALRQPGSTLKPFLYAQAIAERRLTAASLLDDSPAHISTASGLYIPQNYDRRFKGWVSARTALGASLNVPAVRALVMVSPDAFARQLRALGITLREPAGYYGYSLALGSAEMSLLELTNAYRALANGGHLSPVRRLPSDPRAAPVRALDTGAAFIVGDILSDNQARARTFGSDSVLVTRFWSAVKTGTSKDMRDNWAVGWSARYTVGVWVGNAGGSPMHDVSGSHGAAPVWAAVMQFLHEREPSRAPAAPAGLQRAAVTFGADLEAARLEWFLPGTSQARYALAPAPAAATRILAPVNGSIVALDPDIPPAHQRLTFQAEGTGQGMANGVRWRVGGREVGRGTQAQWLPWPGRQVVQLLDAKGQLLDEVRIEVRGAAPKAGVRRPGAAPAAAAGPPARP